MNNFLPLSQTAVPEEDLRRANPLSLSFVGDGVHTLYIRTKGYPEGHYKNGAMHFMAIKEVCAERQAELAKIMEPMLTENELYIFKKARSAKVHTVPGHATTYQYNMATAFEAVVGYLYLSSQNDRLKELMDALYGGEK
ncbi:MAG: ribonuclease III [Clostridia bacterium]|nr:ribonuclease III [Clostridia bacterium]